jgi:hypothetical protein
VPATRAGATVVVEALHTNTPPAGAASHLGAAGVGAQFRRAIPHRQSPMGRSTTASKLAPFTTAPVDYFIAASQSKRPPIARRLSFDAPVEVERLVGGHAGLPVFARVGVNDDSAVKRASHQ